jgi:hypothetical protein
MEKKDAEKRTAQEMFRPPYLRWGPKAETAGQTLGMSGNLESAAEARGRDRAPARVQSKHIETLPGAPLLQSGLMCPPLLFRDPRAAWISVVRISSPRGGSRHRRHRLLLCPTVRDRMEHSGPRCWAKLSFSVQDPACEPLDRFGAMVLNPFERCLGGRGPSDRQWRELSVPVQLFPANPVAFGPRNGSTEITYGGHHHSLSQAAV